LAIVSVLQLAVPYVTAGGARIEFTSTYVRLYKQFSKPFQKLF
jgi:hypothetical protein